MNTISMQPLSYEHPEHHHISLLYDSAQQRLEFLANYLQVGFERNELCIIVGQQSQHELTVDLQRVGLSLEKYLRQGQLRVFNARETYLAGNSFVVEYILCNLSNFVYDATMQGYSGLRIAGEINWQHTGSTGLCLCPINSNSLEAIEAAEPSWLQNAALTPSIGTALSNTSIKKVLLGAGKP